MIVMSFLLCRILNILPFTMILKVAAGGNPLWGTSFNCRLDGKYIHIIMVSALKLGIILTPVAGRDTFDMLFPQDVETTGDCTAECNAEPTCKFWAHMSVPKNCFLYTTLNAKTPNFNSGWSCGTRSA